MEGGGESGDGSGGVKAGSGGPFDKKMDCLRFLEYDLPRLGLASTVIGVD